MTLWSDINGQVGINGKPIILTDADAVSAALENIYVCPVGSRPWNPTFGSIIPFLLWENSSAKVASNIRIDAIQSGTKWEPRVILLPEYTDAVMLLDGAGYKLQVGWIVKATNFSGTSTFNLLR